MEYIAVGLWVFMEIIHNWGFGRLWKHIAVGLWVFMEIIHNCGALGAHGNKRRLLNYVPTTMLQRMMWTLVIAHATIKRALEAPVNQNPWSPSTKIVNITPQ